MALSSNRDNVNGNWLKALWALELTKQGLRSYVTNTFEYLHKRIYSSIERAHRLSADVTCGDFRTENVVPCPTQDLCKREKCENHNTPDKSPRPCPAQLCDAVKDEIVRYHRHQKPKWRNTRSELWGSNPGPGPWELAKCFMPNGYTDSPSFEATDFHGVIWIFINCVEFQKRLSFEVGSTPNILSEVGFKMQITSVILHSCLVVNITIPNICTGCVRNFGQYANIRPPM